MAVVAACACAVGGCGAARDPAAAAKVGEPDTIAQRTGEVPAPRTFTEQLVWGEELFAERCAGCHGERGGAGPPLIGLGALPRRRDHEPLEREEEFVTAADVLDFVARHMPDNDPGSLAREQYEAVVAWVLYVNALGMHLGADGVPLTDAIADEIPLRP